MTNSGRDPRREARRAGQNPVTPRATDGDFVLGSDGQPLRDRYGRPVLRRSPGGNRRPPRRSEPEYTRFDLGPHQQTPQPQQTRFDVPRQQHPQQFQQPQAQQPPVQPRQAPPPGYQQPGYQQQGYSQAGYQQQGYQQQGYQEPVRRYAPPMDAPPTNARPHRRRKKTNPFKAAFGCFGWALAIVLVFTLAFTLWTDSRLTRTAAFPDQQIADTAGTNWLLVGSDSRQGLSEEDQATLGTGGDVGVGRTDTIMLLHIPQSGNARLVSIPRDSYVEVPGFGFDKINASFTYGGPPLLTQTVEQATGIRIDHYAEIGMGGLANVVDSVGGVNICVDEPINDPLAGIDLAAGCQDLEGPQALGYVRTRASALGDLDRVERQREFFAALLNKITSPGTLANPFRLVSLVNHTSNSFIVDDGDHVWHLARVALAMSKGVDTETVPVGGFQDTAVGNVVIWDETGAQELFDSMR